jgi:hypothetical protein
MQAAIPMFEPSPENRRERSPLAGCVKHRSTTHTTSAAVSGGQQGDAKRLDDLRPPLSGPLSENRDTPQPNLPAQSRRRPISLLLPPMESEVVGTAGLLPAPDFDSDIFSSRSGWASRQGLILA